MSESMQVWDADLQSFDTYHPVSCTCHKERCRNMKLICLDCQRKLTPDNSNMAGGGVLCMFCDDLRKKRTP